MAGITEDEAVARINQYMKTAAETEIDGLRQLLQSVREQCTAEAHAQDVPFDTQYDDTLSIRVRRTMAGDLIGAIEGAEDVRAAARERLEAMQGEYIHDLSGREAQAMQNRTLREIYDYMGYETVWVTTTGECDLCQRLNGMVVGAGSRFTVDTQTSRLYPPIHKGCTCQIVDRRRVAPHDDEETIIGLNVKEEYEKNAKPGIGSLDISEVIDIGKHKDEIEMAEYLLMTFGGEIKLIPESRLNGKKTPDYVWHKQLWEKKDVHSVEAVDRQVRKGIKQIKGSGGIILLRKGEMQIDEIKECVTHRIARSKIENIDIMVIMNWQVEAVWRYKK